MYAQQKQMSSQQQQRQIQSISTAQSMAVVKNCIRLAISTVCYQRQLFPKDTFVNKVYAGMKLDILRPFGPNGQVYSADAFQVFDWVENGAFRALELGYLDRFIFNVLDLHPDNPKARVLESYTFRIGRESELVRSSTNLTATISERTVTKEDVQDIMQKLIKTLVMLTSSLQPLPETRWLSVSVAYNSNAPASYEAPQFSPQDPRKEPTFGKDDPLMIPLGEINTGHQTLAVEFRQVDTELQTTTDEYKSDSTETKWEREKMEMIQQAQEIILNARRDGVSEEMALKTSKIAESMPSALLDEILSKITKLGFNKAAASYGRVKRPLQQLQSLEEAKKSKLQD